MGKIEKSPDLSSLGCFLLVSTKQILEGFCSTPFSVAITEHHRLIYLYLLLLFFVIAGSHVAQADIELAMLLKMCPVVSETARLLTGSQGVKFTFQI